jgi:hypothetical protein
MIKRLRFSLLSMLMMLCGTVFAGSITFADLGLENGVQYTDPFDGDDFTVTFAGGGNDGKYYTTGTGIRVYGNGTMTIEAKSGTLTSITITYDGSNKPDDTDVVNVGTYDPETGVWTGNAASVTFTRPTGSGHWRVKSVEATVDNGGTPVVTKPAKPTFNPEGKTFTESVEVAIACKTSGAAIYYTLDGTTPTAESTPYTAAFTLTETTTVKAIAVKDGESSDVAEATYTKEEKQEGEGVSKLEFTAACGGTGTADDNVVWTVTSDGEESNFDNARGIHYGTNSKAVGNITLTTNDISGTITSIVVNASTASGVTATVDVTVGGAAFGGEAQALSTTATDYTFNGSASGEIVVTVKKPASATKALYIKSITVTYSDNGGTPGPQTTVYSVAGTPATLFGAEWNEKATATEMTKNTETGLYEWTATNVELTAGQAEFKVMMNHDWNNAWPESNWVLYISEDGIYTVAITFNEETKVITAEATKTGNIVPAKPVFTPEGGSFIGSIEVAIACATNGATIYYTLDGSVPTAESTQYTAAFTLTETTTVKAIAVKDGETSDVAEATFTSVVPISVADALAIIDELGNGKTTTESYLVEGYITSISEYSYGAENYGNATFIIADTQDAENGLTAYRTFAGPDKKKFMEEGEIKVGDKVILYGQLQKYVNKEIVTPEMKNGYVYSIVEKAPQVNVYSIAGTPATLFGAEWNEKATATEMTKNTETGLYEWTATDVELTAGQAEFKVVMNHDWNNAWPESNWVLYIAEDGVYTVAITFNEDTKEITAEATKTGDIVIPTTTEITFDFNTYDHAVSSSESNDGDITENEEFTESGAVMTVTPNEEGTANRFWGTANGPQLRMYGGTMTIVAPEGKAIVKAVFNNGKWNAGNQFNGFAAEKGQWEGNSTDLILAVAGNTQINKVILTIDDKNEGTTTGISSMNNVQCTMNNEVYNLNGQKVMKAQKGLYIINGKKVVIK